MVLFSKNTLLLALIGVGLGNASADLDFSFSPLAGGGTQLSISGDGVWDGSGAFGAGQTADFAFGSGFAVGSDSLFDLAAGTLSSGSLQFAAGPVSMDQVVVNANTLSFGLDDQLAKGSAFDIDATIDFGGIVYTAVFTGPTSQTLSSSDWANPGTPTNSPGTISVNVANGTVPIPEPTSFLLGGLALVFATSRRRRKA